jgi:hypothetical protein
MDSPLSFGFSSLLRLRHEDRPGKHAGGSVDIVTTRKHLYIDYRRAVCGELHTYQGGSNER